MGLNLFVLINSQSYNYPVVVGFLCT